MNNRKKSYVEPQAELVELMAEDVILTSADSGDENVDIDGSDW